jgi:hypothetical protein
LISRTFTYVVFRSYASGGHHCSSGVRASRLESAHIVVTRRRELVCSFLLSAAARDYRRSHPLTATTKE